jgi:carbon-monoxide dehydrogenase small subunit
MQPVETACVAVTVNGQVVQEQVPVRLTLADFLRERLGLTGTHLGCEQGVCGACSILLDGVAVRSCLLLAVQADGHTVTTIEGLLPDTGLERTLTPLMRAMQAHHGLQCGFCTPGVIITLTAFLHQQPHATAAEIREALAANICRCTGYQGMVEAALSVVRQTASLATTVTQKARQEVAG